MKMCAKCGGSMKKGGATKKMAKGGVQKIVGMPGYNATTYPTTMKKGGAKKSLPKAQKGIVGSNAQEISSKIERPQYTIDPSTLKEANAPGTEPNTPIKRNIKKDIRNATRYIKKEARVDRQNDRKSAKGVQKGFKPISGPSFKKGGSTFGMLSVKAGIDKNPKPTAADRIAGAKMKKKMGGSTKRK